jgi:hypothetical protein
VIRSLTQLHESPGLIARAQTPVGRCAVWIMGAALLLWHSKHGPLSAGGNLLIIVICAIPLVTAWPGRKRFILSVASALAIGDFFRRHSSPELQFDMPQSWFLHGPEEWLRVTTLVAVTLLSLYAFYLLLMRFTVLPAPVRKYPVILLHLGIWLALLCIPVFQAPSIIQEVLPFVAWRLSYLIQFASRGQVARTGFGDHLFYLYPVYGPIGVPTPLGKGLEYLSRHEAKDAEQWAQSQLAGLKLLMLAFVWELLLHTMDTCVYGGPPGRLLGMLGGASLDLPRLNQLMNRDVTDAPIVVASLYLELVRMSLFVAVYGHIIVGSLRLLGFRVFRHAYRPLLATSIVEFWGRWSYYYKELLTEFFFFPTFLRSAWASPRLRLFLAVFAAAALGNMYFQILWEVDLLLRGDVQTMWTRWASRTVYCIILASGIWVSMLRQQRARKLAPAPRKRWSRIRAAFLVCSFYAVAHVWNVRESTLGPLDRLLWLFRVAW